MNEVDYSPKRYVGNGITKEFPFDWKVFKDTNSYRLFNERIKPLVNIGACKKIVSNYDKRKDKQNAKMENSRELRSTT